MSQKIVTIFNDALINLENYVESAAVSQKMNLVKLKPVRYYNNPKTRKETKFAKEYRVPAFYDPNKHVIFYNPKILKKRLNKTIYEILTHELIHSISDHSIVSRTDGTILKSGIKQQHIINNSEKCYFRGLNEGLVQYLCNKITRQKSAAYEDEMQIIAQLVFYLGEEVVVKSFLTNNDFELEKEIQEKLGWKWLIAMSRQVDNKQYAKAKKMIQERFSLIARSSGENDNGELAPARLG